MAAFVAIVDTGGFTEAAKKIHMSKSAISKYITNLESRLNIRLLDRTTRETVPTDVGLLYYQEAVRVLELAQSADEMVMAKMEHPQGHLRISTSVASGQKLIAPLMHEFLRQYPDISAELIFENRQVNLLSEGFDCAFRIGELQDSSLIARKLGVMKMSIVAAPNFLKNRNFPDNFNDFDSRECLNFPPTFYRKDISKEARLSINDISSILEATIDELGISILPGFIVREPIKKGQLVEIYQNYDIPSKNVHLLYRATPYLQPKVRVFIDYFVENMKGKI